MYEELIENGYSFDNEDTIKSFKSILELSGNSNLFNGIDFNV